MALPERHPAPSTLPSEGKERLRRDLAEAGLSAAKLPQATDQAILEAIRRTLQAPSEATGPSELAATRGRRHVPWTRWIRTAAVAAVVTLVAWLSISVPNGERWADARLVAAARIVERAKDRQALLADPRLRALLTAVVTMPKSLRSPTSAGGEFVQFDLLLDDPRALPLSWLIEVELPGTLVGIEGGDGPYAEPATYDPDALASGWVRLANVATDVAVGEGPIRIATLMVQRGDLGPPRVLEHVGVGAAGESLALAVRCVERVKGGTEQ